MPMLAWKPENRATAQQLLVHPWLKTKCAPDYLMSEEDYNLAIQKLQVDDDVYNNKEPVDEMGLSDGEQFDADEEINSDDADTEEDKELADNPRDYLLYNDHGPNRQFMKKEEKAKVI